MNDEPIWITGLGMNVPHGTNISDVAYGLFAGKSAIHAVTNFDVSNHPCRIGAKLTRYPKPDGWIGEFETAIPIEQLTIWSITNALREAGLWEVRDQRRIGFVFSCSGETCIHWEAMGLSQGAALVADPANDRPRTIDRMRQAFGFTGPSIAVSTACSSGNYAFAQAKRWLNLGWCDAVVIAAVDQTMTPIVLAAFGNLRALSRRNDDPTAASRPFDVDRDGFVMAEGSTAFVLEPASSVKKRSAHVWGELAGVGLTSDAYHPVIPAPEPKQAVMAVRKALADAKINPAMVNYVNAHGTSTPVGDIAESKALREVFGEDYRNIPVSSTKSMSGHLITAASAFEAMVCLLAIQRNAVPPTINLNKIDPECELCHVPNVTQERRVDIAISNAFGFGGSNSCAVFRRV